MVFILLRIVVPALRAWFRVPARPAPPAEGVAAAIAILIGMLFLCGLGEMGRARESSNDSVLMAQGSNGAKPGPEKRATSLQRSIPLPESVTQQVRVEDKFAFATAKVRWRASKGQVMPILLASCPHQDRLPDKLAAPGSGSDWFAPG